ncbi:hypothetical protein Tco_1493261 [Tanacetum coccineum]
MDTQPLVLSTYADVRAFLLSDDEAQESEKDTLGADKPQSSHAPSTEALDTDFSCDDILKKYDNTLPLTERQLVKYLRKVLTVLFDRITEESWVKHQEAAVNYANLKASIDDYYDENVAHRDQTDKLVEASMSSLDKSRTTISDLYKGLNIITELLKEINNAVKDDPVINKKINAATESFTKISTNITEAHALKQDEELAAWAKSSTNMAWNLGSRLSGLERAQNHIQSSMSSLKEDTHSIKTIITEMYGVFKGQSSGIVTPTLALTHIPANVEGENDTNTTTEDPPSHTEGETDANKEGKGIATDEQIEDQRKLVKASSIIRPDANALIPYTINGEVYYLNAEQLQAHMDKEEQIKKAEEEARLFAISKPEVIKVRKKPRSLEFNQKRQLPLRLTISSRLKPETITDIKIHPKTKPVVITVFRGTNGRNFDVHKPFSFGEFGISELDELREIIPRKKNAVSALPAPAPAPEQASSKSSRKKRKHMELEPEIKIPGLECNRALPKNVLFVNNMVIEEPEHGIFFTDEFGDQAFQRWSDIDKVGMEALVSYLVAASMVQSPENARFSMKLKKLIAEHPDQEKLKSKKVKLEALGYEMN